MKWFRKIIESRRPKYTNALGFAWPLLLTRWFGLGLVLRYRSDSRFDQRAEFNRVRVVLEGEYLEHREIARTGLYEAAERAPKGAYTYGNSYGLWACVNRRRGSISFEPVGRRGGVELLDARTTEERIQDFPDWMAHHEVVFDGQRHVVMLVLTWGECWR